MAVNAQTSARHGSKRLNVSCANTSRCRRSANDPGDRLPDEQGSAQGHRIFCSGPSRGMRKNRCPLPGRALKMPERGAARPRPPISQMMDFIRCPTAHVYMRKRGGKPRITWGRANLPGAAVCPVCYPAGALPVILTGHRCGPSQMPPRASRSMGLGRTTASATVRARFGTSCDEGARTWPASPWNG